MGGGCCAVSSVSKPSLRHEGLESRARSFRNISESLSDRKTLESFINLIIANNSPSEAMGLLLEPYFDSEMHCNGKAQILAHCQDCDRLLCAGCFMDGLHAHHSVNLVQNLEELKCQCTSRRSADAKSACSVHIALNFGNLLQIDLRILLAAFAQGKQVLEKLSVGEPIDPHCLTANDFVLRILVFAAFFDGNDEEIAAIEGNDCVELAKKAQALDSKKWLFEQQNCCFLFADQLFRACCARWLAQHQENTFFWPCFQFGFDARAFSAFDVHQKAINAFAKRIDHGEIQLVARQATYYRILEQCFCLEKCPQEAMQVISILITTINATLYEQPAIFSGSTTKFMAFIQPYVDCATDVLLPALNGMLLNENERYPQVSGSADDFCATTANALQDAVELIQQLIQQQAQVSKHFAGIDETAQTVFSPLPDLTYQLLLMDLFTCQSAKVVIKQLASLLNMTCDDLVLLLLKEPVRWMSSIELVQLEDSLFNCRKLFSMFSGNEKYLRVYFLTCRFAAYLLETQSQPFSTIQKLIFANEKFAVRCDLLSVLVLIQMFSVEARDLQCLRQEILCNEYFLSKDCRQNTMPFERLAEQVFQQQVRRNPLLSARLVLKDLSFFRPQVFPLLPDHYFTNVMLSSQSITLMEELHANANECGISRITNSFPCLEELYFDQAVKIQQKLRLLSLMLHRSFRSKKVLRFPEQRLRGLEEKVFKISQTTDFSRSFNRLLSNRSTQDCVLQDDETPCESLTCSDATPTSDDEQHCVYCQQRVLNPVYFAQIEQMCSGKRFIKACLHQAHYKCYVAQRSSHCPACRMAVNYLLADRQQMKDIGALFSVTESQLLGVILDSIEHCQFISRLADVSSEQKRKIIGPSLQTLRILQKLIYIGDAREKQIGELLRFSEQEHLLNPAIFPSSATRWYLSAVTSGQSKCTCAVERAPLVCLRCGVCLCSECFCACGGFLRWNVCENRIESNNGLLDLPAPYRNERGQVPGSIFQCGELLFDGTMLDEIRRRILK